MKRKTISVAAVALASGLLFSISQIVGVDADNRGCSNKTLKGSYGFYRTGTRNLEPFPGPLVAVGLISFDGNGNNTVVQDTSRNGNFVFGSPGDGSYEVAEDCSGKFFDAAGNEVSRIVVVDDGKEIYALSLMANTAIYGVFKKIDNRQKDHH